MVEISSGESVTNTILATPGHFIFASDANSTFSDAVAVPAEDLTEATVLWSLVDNRLLPCKVHSAIETVEENGMGAWWLMVVWWCPTTQPRMTEYGSTTITGGPHKAMFLHRAIYNWGCASSAWFRAMNDFVLAPLFAG